MEEILKWHEIKENQREDCGCVNQSDDDDNDDSR